MYRVLDKSEQATVGIWVDYKLTMEDWSDLFFYLQKRRNEVGRLNILFDFTKLESEKLRSCWPDLISRLQEFSEIQRLAVTANESCGEAHLREIECLPYTEVKCFLPEQFDEAWNWLKRENA